MQTAEVNLFQGDATAEVPNRKKIHRIKKQKDPGGSKWGNPQDEMCFKRELGHQLHRAF